MSDDGVFTIHTDGGARGNPGPAAYAYVIERPGADDIEVGQRLGEATNNVAEYTALVRALEHAKQLGGKRLLVHSDSELMVKQMRGEYKVKHPGLMPLFRKAKELSDDFDEFTIRHVRREYNTRADRLYNDALDGMETAPGPVKPVPLPPKKEKPLSKSKPAGEGTSPHDKVRKQAVAYLWTQAALWAQGDPDEPDPEAVWDELWKILEAGGVVKRPE